MKTGATNGSVSPSRAWIGWPSSPTPPARELSHSFDLGSSAYSLVREDGGIYANLEDRNPPKPGIPREILAQPIGEDEFLPITFLLGTKGIKSDWFDESMCDRFAAQASLLYLWSLPEAGRSAAGLEGQMDVVVMACNEAGLIDEDQSRYPSFRTRVEKLYFGHPGIGELTGCK